MSTYFVSTEGKVYKNNKEKKLTLDRNYLITAILGKKYLVHRLVAEKYIPNPENKKQVNHINGNKLDNRVENLEWTTPQENLYHRDNILKTCIWGDRAGNSKLSNTQAECIREEYSLGNTTYKKLSKKYKVCSTTIARIIRRETFSKYE